MTALCLNCGARKPGPVTCPTCGAAPTGRPELDGVFDDQHISPAGLDALGGIIRRIHAAGGDPDLRMWIFVCYVSERVPGLLKADPPDRLEDAVAQSLKTLELPTVTVMPALRAVPAPPPEPGIGWTGWMIRIGTLIMFGVWVAVTFFIE